MRKLSHFGFCNRVKPAVSSKGGHLTPQHQTFRDTCLWSSSPDPQSHLSSGFESTSTYRANVGSNSIIQLLQRLAVCVARTVAVCVQAAQISALTRAEWKSFCCINSWSANDGVSWLLKYFYSPDLSDFRVRVLTCCEEQNNWRVEPEIVAGRMRLCEPI